jgi:CubicO group peptidase (beta-lactamase class C family)
LQHQYNRRPECPLSVDYYNDEISVKAINMKRLFLTHFLALVASLTMMAQQAPNTFEAEVDEVLSAWNNPDKPGVAAGIIRNGEVIYLKGFGSANLETGTKITPQTKFQLGELSKQFTTLAILILEQQGKIAQREDIRKYLPELPEYAYTVTINHLLNHSSGLHGVEQVSNMIKGSTDIRTQVKALELIAAQKILSFEPGTDFSFHESVTESILMAEIVARSSGQSYADFVKSNIFEPLGMKNSLIRDDSEAILPNVAQPYQEEGEDFKKNYALSSVVGAINAYSSAEDLTKWYLHFTNPDGKLGQLVQSLDTPAKLSNGKKFNYYWGDMAIGREFTHPERGLPLYWNFGLQGGYGANVFRYVDQKITSFVLGNNNQYNGSLAMDAVDPLVRDLFLLPPAVDYTTLETKALSASELKSFEGHYWYKKAGYATKIFVENDTLRNQWLFSTRSVELLPISDNAFQQLGTNDDVRLYKFKKEGNRERLFFTYNDSEPDIMERYEPVIPSEQSLRSYAGTYYNAAYGSLFSFYIEDGQLKAKNLDHQPIEFKPVKKDVFTSTSAFMTALEFLRDTSGEVKGFEVDTDGIHGLIFERVPSVGNLSD